MDFPSYYPRCSSPIGHDMMLTFSIKPSSTNALFNINIIYSIRTIRFEDKQTLKFYIFKKSYKTHIDLYDRKLNLNRII